MAEGLKTDQRPVGGSMMAASEVIVIGGAPFSGKTTLAKRLAAERGYALVAIDDLGTALRALTTPQSHPALYPVAGWDYRACDVAHPPPTLIEHGRREHQALWPAIAAVIHAHLWAEPVILEGWQLGPEGMRAVSHPQLRACWLLVDDAVLEARLRVDTAFYHGCADVERLIRHYLARSRWVNDRVRQATGHEASAVIQVGPDDTVDALVTRCLRRLWPGEASWWRRVGRLVPGSQA
jgi:2-phosphoglycerate kinase